MEMTLEQRKERIKKWGTIGLIGVAGLLVSPIIFFAIKGMLGLAIAAIVGVTLMAFAPWFGMKLANWKLQAIKAEARKNPVETMQNVLLDKVKELQQREAKIKAFATKVKSFKSQLDAFKASMPHKKEAIETFENTYRSMNLLLEDRRARWARFRDRIEAYKQTITEADALWQMSQAALSLRESAGETEDSIIEDIKVKTSLQSVTDSMNEALVELDQAMMERVDIPEAVAELPPPEKVGGIEILPAFKTPTKVR
jgi:hypothetical protein